MIKLTIDNKEYSAQTICIENENGVMNFMPNCAKFAGYGDFLYFIDSHGHKHTVNKFIIFEINKNVFIFDELVEDLN